MKRLYRLCSLACLFMEQERLDEGRSLGMKHTDSPCALCDRALFWHRLGRHFGRKAVRA